MSKPSETPSGGPSSSPTWRKKVGTYKQTICDTLESGKDFVLNFISLTAKNFKNLNNPNYHAQTTPEERQLSKALDKTQLSLLKMPIEAFIGKTMVGEQLTPLDRILYILIAATNRFAYIGGALAVKEQNAQLGVYAGISYGVSRGLYTLQRTPNLIRDLKEFAENKNLPTLKKFASLLEQAARKVGFEKLQAFQHRIQEKLSGSAKPE